MSKLFIDTETFSPVPIKAGVHRYAEKVEVMLFAWALDDGPVQVWDVTRDVSPAAELWDALFDDATEVWAHNSHFDRTVLRHALRDLCPPLHRWRDTMVQAYAHSLPGSLDMLCQVLGVAQDKAKDKEGKALVRMFCMPDAKGQRNTRETHPEQWAKFITYAGQDIVAMRECHRIMPKWNYPNNADEVALWHLDQRINDRGVAIDTDLAEAAVRAVNLAQAKLAQQTVDMTGGQVQTATQRDAMLAHILEAYGVALPNLQASTLERRIADPDLPEPLRELLAVRLQASTTSTSKYQTLIRSTSSDGRLRGLLQFNGAARTGRWAGRLFQPQNLPRPTMKDAAIELGIEALKADAADLVFDNVMALTSNTIRGCIIAPPGKKLVVADLSNIEGRDQAWLAGEQWKLQAFCDFDAGTGHDLYALAYAKSFGVTPEEVMANKKTGDGSMRQIGKVQELALGYEGGVGAFVTFAAVYGIDLEDLPTKVLPAADDELVAEARDFLGWLADQKGQTFGLSDDAFVACDVLKRAWRRAHPAIASMWRDLRDAAVNAIESPGKTFQVRALKLRRDANWLCIVLPSGRALCYPSPRVDEVNGKDTVTYMGIDQYTRKWSRLKTYGGKLFENCIAGGTPVLTRRGWVPIEQVRRADAVWDGIEWVSHKGCTYRGKQFVISSFGVWMTPDHRVLTTEGWRRASQIEGHHRAACGLPDRSSVPRGEQGEIHMGRAVRLRGGDPDAGDRAEEAAGARSHCVVRVHAPTNDQPQSHAARNVETPGLRGVAFDVSALREPTASRVQELRGAGYRRLRKLAGFLRGLLGGHGADVPGGDDPGTPRERAGLLPGKLHLGDSESPSKQHPHRAPTGHPVGRDVRTGGGQSVRGQVQHPAVPTDPRLGVAPRAEPVFDLIDCGPRHRFVVMSEDGQPLIVHNCCQAAARDVMGGNMPDIEAAGYEIVLTVHDEVLTETPDTDEHTVDHLASLLAATPAWAPDMPLAAAGFETTRYRKD